MPAKPEGTDTTRFWMLAALVVAMTVGVIVVMSGGNDEAKPEQAEQSAADDSAVEEKPLLPEGKIVSASWRDRPVEDGTDHEASASMLDGNLDPFNKDAEKNKRAEESLKETVDRIHGLGVYVAPAEEDAKDK